PIAWRPRRSRSSLFGGFFLMVTGGGAVIHLIRILWSQCRLDLAEQRREIEGLGENLGAARGQRIVFYVVSGVGADRKNWCTGSRAAVPKLPRRFDTIEFRHRQIHQDQIGI